MSDLTNKLEGMDEKELSALYMRVFNNDDGRLVLEDLRNRAFVKVTTLSPDPMQMAWREGTRSMVLTIETFLKPEEKGEQKQ